MSFDDFIQSHPKFGKCREAKSAQDVFTFLTDPLTIYNMIKANDEGKPALYGSIPELEEQFGERTDFDFADPFVKQTVGVMVKYILEPFGYSSNLQKNMPSGKTKFFASGMHYSYDPSKARCKLVPSFRIEHISDK